MLKETLIILLLIALIYYYRQSQKPLNFTGSDETISEGKEFAKDLGEKIKTIRTFLKEQLNSDDLGELKTKLGEKTLDELLEANEDYETEVDTLTRTKESLEADLTAQAEAFQARVREKDREVKKLKEDLSSSEKRLKKSNENLTSEKQQHKGSLERVSLLTKQIGDLEQEKKDLTAKTIEDKDKKIKELEQQVQELQRTKSPMPGEFPEVEKTQGGFDKSSKEALEASFQEQLRAINLLFDEKSQDYEKIDFEILYKLLGEVAERERERTKWTQK